LTIENGGVSTLEIINILLTDGDIGVFSRDVTATQFAGTSPRWFAENVPAGAP